MPSSTYTAAQLAALEAAIARGVMSVRMGDKEVRFQSLAEMERLASKMRRQIAGTSRVYRARVGRG